VADEQIDSADDVSKWVSSNPATLVISQELVMPIREGTGSIRVKVLTGSVGETVSLDLGSGSEVDLTGHEEIRLWVRSTKKGFAVNRMLDFGFGEAAASENSRPMNVHQVNIWEQRRFNIRGVADSAKDALRFFEITILDDSEEFEFYIDDLRSVLLTNEAIIDIDAALEKLFGTLQLRDSTGTLKDVPVFIERPEGELVEGRNLPCFNIHLWDAWHDPERQVYDDTIENQSDTEVEIKGEIKAYTFAFELSCVAALVEDNRRMQNHLLSKFRARDFITVYGQRYWILFEDWRPRDAPGDGDDRRFHSVWEFQVETEIDDTIPEVKKLVLVSKVKVVKTIVGGKVSD